MYYMTDDPYSKEAELENEFISYLEEHGEEVREDLIDKYGFMPSDDRVEEVCWDRFITMKDEER